MPVPAPFLERESDFSGNAIALTRGEKLVELARNLVRELDLLHRDVRDAGMDKPNVWAKFIDYSRLSAISEAYGPREKLMRELAAEILEAPDKADLLDDLGKKLSSVISEIEAATHDDNAHLIHEMAAQLQQLVADK